MLTESFRRFEKVLHKIGVEASETEFRHVTSVFIEAIGREVNLEALAIGLGLEHTEYEPEQFTGHIYGPPQYEVTLLIFASGKIIIGGTTDREHARSAIQHLQEELSFLDTA